MRNGYVFLATVLLVGAIATAVVTSLLFIAVNGSRTTLVLQQSSLSHSYAMTCAEIALRSMRSNGSYAGSETVTMANGTCTVYAISATGDDGRVVCVEGTSGATKRRMEIVLSSLIPSVAITSWQEVPQITLCPTS